MTLLKRLVRRLKFAGEDDDLSQETDEYVIEVIGIKKYMNPRLGAFIPGRKTTSKGASLKTRTIINRTTMLIYLEKKVNLTEY